MTLDSISDLLINLPISQFIRRSAWAFPTIESVHVVSMTLLAGTITIVDLRLIGLASRSYPITELSRDTLKWTWIAFLISAITGTIMVVSKADQYYDVPAFWLKFLFMACAGLNMLIFEFLTFRSVKEWDTGASIPRAAKIAGILSLGFWALVIILGRWIGYTVVGGSVFGHGF